jgi:ATP-dependent DNA helicase DinG
MSVVAGDLVGLARLLLHRGDDGGAPINRNGVGFSAADYPFVRDLLARVDSCGGGTTAWQEHALARVLARYARQGAALGFDVPALVAPVLARPPADNVVDAPQTPSAVPSRSGADVPVPAPRRAAPRMADVLGPGGVVARALPGYEARAPQVALAQRVADALAAGDCLLAEAGTGVGKSLAYLVPAIYSGKKTIVSTEGKALQDQLVGKDLPFLKKVLGVEFTFAKLKGLPNYVCELKLAEEVGQQQLLGESAEFAAFRRWYASLPADASGDVADAPFSPSPDLLARVTSTTEECLGRDCPYAATCRALRAKQVAAEADVLVVNHTLLALDLDVRARTDDGVAVLPDRAQVVVDEAHALEEVATKAFAREIGSGRVPALCHGRLPALAKIDTAELAAAKTASDAFFAELDRVLGPERSTAPVTPTPRLRTLASDVAVALKPLARRARACADDGAADRAVRARLERYHARLLDTADLFAGMLDGLDGTHVLYAEREQARRGETRLALKLAPLSVADDLHAALWSKWPTVAVSATLTATPVERGGSPFGYVRSRLGCTSAAEMVVGSPFDYKRNALVYLPADGALFDPSRYYADGSAAYFDRLADQIEQLLAASDGRAFCLFTSRRALREVHERLAPRMRWLTLVQGDASAQELVRRFKADGRAVLFGLRSFWTGVDVQGGALSLVVIDKLPFPSPDEPVYQARCDHLTRTSGDKWAWFGQIAVPVCSIAFKQGFGRLIRTQTDTGVVALLDGRLTTKSYGAHILRALPPAPVVRSIDAVRAFYAARVAA